jgi:hypothetical protein
MDKILHMTSDCKPAAIAMNQTTFDALQIEYNEHRKIFANFPTNFKELNYIVGAEIQIDNSLNDIELCL